MKSVNNTPANSLSEAPAFGESLNESERDVEFE